MTSFEEDELRAHTEFTKAQVRHTLSALSDVRDRWLLARPEDFTELAFKEIALTALSVADRLVRPIGETGGFLDSTRNERLNSIVNDVNSVANLSPVNWDALSAVLRSALILGREYFEHLRSSQASSNELANVWHSFSPGLIAAISEGETVATDLDRKRLQRAVDVAESAAARTEAVQKDVEEAAGKVADGSLAIYFRNFAAIESRRAFVYRAIMVSCIVLGTALAVGVLRLEGEAAGLTAQAAAKGLISLPVLTLGIYFGREAGLHSSAARDARGLEVRLQTLAAYVADLDREAANVLRKEFGKSLFYAHGGSTSTPGVSAKELSDIVAQVAEMGENAKKVLGK